MDTQPHPEKRPKYPIPITRENILRIFEENGDFNKRKLLVGPEKREVWVFSIDGLVSGGDISDFVVKPLLQSMAEVSIEMTEEIICNAEGASVNTMDEVCAKLVNGFCIVLFEEGAAAAFEVKTGEKRSISGPEVENTIKGPKDSFTETIRTNTSLLRRHLRSPELRIQEMVVGRRSLTNVAICSIGGLTNQNYVAAVKERLSAVDVDGFLTPAAVEEYLTGGRSSAFPVQLYTERPDRFAWGLLSGRVGVLVDGLPLGYLLPCDIGDLLESPEDRSGNYQIASCLKFLRYISALTALLLPGFFCAISLYHQEMIPTAWLMAISESRQAVPFSAGTEVLILLIAFELLQEAGLHLPQNLGQAVSIIGGLVVGSAAVEAGLISPAALIVVAAAGVCGYTQPQRDFADAIRLWRFIIAIGGLLAGLAGVGMVLLLLLIHLAELSSLGLPYLWPLCQGKLPVLRGPLRREKYRAEKLHPQNIRNQR